MEIEMYFHFVASLYITISIVLLYVDFHFLASIYVSFFKDIYFTGKEIQNRKKVRRKEFHLVHNCKLYSALVSL